MGAKAPQIPKYNPPTPPPYSPLDISNVNQQAIAADTSAYQLSDYQFQQQNPQLAQAQQDFQKQMLTDVQGNQPMPPGVQNEMMRAGLTQAGASMGATGAFGGAGSAAGGPGAAATAGQSAVARNFGLNTANYLQQQKAIGESELALGTSMFPRREYGIGGAGVAQGMITENTNRNNYNWGVYGAQVQQAEFQENLAAQQAGLNASASNANTSSMMSLGGSAMGAIGGIAGAFAI